MSLFETKKPSLEISKTGSPFIQPGQFSDEEFPIATIIQRRRLQILVHSRLYYELNVNLIRDSEFDSFARELVILQRDYPEISEKVCYAEAFKDWDGSTGAFLPLNDEWVVRKASELLTGRKASVNEHSKIFQKSRINDSEKVEGQTSGKQWSNSVSKGRCGLF